MSQRVKNSVLKLLATLTILSTCVLLMSCTSSTLLVEEMHSKNSDQRIKFLIMHYTGVDYQGAVRELVNQGGVSSHYLLPESHDKTYLDDDLKVLKLVNEDERAWHAGHSYWQKRRGVNDQSIGIEMVNTSKCEPFPQKKTLLARGQDITAGQMCFFHDYDPKQIELLIKLSTEILKKNPDIAPTNIIGHSDIAPLRKADPGPRFPWYQLYQAGIGAWYDKETVLKYWQLFEQQIPNIALVQQALKHYGYDLNETGKLDQQTQAVLHAFQTHFVPWNITDSVDEQTVATLFALLEKYMPKNGEALLARFQSELVPIAKLQESLNKRGQVDKNFPQQGSSHNEGVNGRAIFKSYQRRGEIIIDNQEAISADIFINGEKLNIEKPLQAYNTYRYSLKRRTRNGNNSVKIENILPEGASLNVTIPYPSLEEKTKKYKQDFIKVDALMNDDVENDSLSAVLVVIKDGKIIKNSAYGYARKFSDGGELLAIPVKMTTNTLFDIASNTKMFATNFALMKLVSEGKLDVSKPISHYLPACRDAGHGLNTVKDILTHHAGDVSNTKRMDSDTGDMLLGMIVEKVTGMTLDKYIEYDIYHPLGLKSTTFNPFKRGFRKNQFAATEIPDITRGNLVEQVHDEKPEHAFSGLFSTGKELAVLAQVLLNRGGYGEKSLFSNKIIDQFINLDDHEDREWRFSPYASASVYGHIGLTDTVTVIDPEHDLAIILLTNACHGEIEADVQDCQFTGKQFETEKYANLISLVYESVF